MSTMPRMPYATPAAAPAKPHRNTARELVETLVFVAVLVLMLKLFVVEAFVIPTGSMAETLLGYNKSAECEQCGFKFPVNASAEAEPEEGKWTPIVGYRCPNCLFCGPFPTEMTPGTGDRVLVHKAMATDERGHVVVFKYPQAPQKKQVAQNYIKRLMGFGGETIALHRGDVYITTKLSHPTTAGPGVSPLDFWEKTPYMHVNDRNADVLFRADQKADFKDTTGFQLFRKPDDIVLEMRRIVFDNNHQPADLPLPDSARWTTEGNGWDNTSNPRFSYIHRGTELGWLRYRHLLPMATDAASSDTTVFEPRALQRLGSRRAHNTTFRPGVITSFLGYNHGKPDIRKDEPIFWVGDLILETRVQIDDPAQQIVMELSKGPNRYQAVFAGGKVELTSTGPGGRPMSSRPFTLTAGQHDLRFANVDCRLRVWVDGKAIDFGGEADYQPAPAPTAFDKDDSRREGWNRANDLEQPASLAATGNVTFSNISLWRDTYHSPQEDSSTEVAAQLETYFVQPGHYLCLGDNSTQSADSRMWGVVPERLMLGRAVFVFWPPNRIGFIR